MRNRNSWKPTKYVFRSGRLRATSDTKELAASSRLIADRVARAYDLALKAHARGRLLDMGCGKAPLYGAYSAHVSDVQCVDWPESLHGSVYVDHACDLAERLPYPDEYFDTIILSDVLEHLPEPKECWREMNRLLVEGGKVILNVPFYYPLHEEPYDFYRYTEHALMRFAKMNGFEVLELNPVGGPFEILADITGKLFASFRMRPVAVVIQTIAGSRTLSRLSHRASSRFPFGYFMVAAKRGPAPE